MELWGVVWGWIFRSLSGRQFFEGLSVPLFARSSGVQVELKYINSQLIHRNIMFIYICAAKKEGGKNTLTLSLYQKIFKSSQKHKGMHHPFHNYDHCDMFEQVKYRSCHNSSNIIFIHGFQWSNELIYKGSAYQKTSQKYKL